MGIAGMVLGTVAVVFAFIPVFGAFITLPCIAVGLPLSAIAFFRNRRQGRGVGMAIAGIATNIAAIVIAVVWLVAIGAAVEDDYRRHRIRGRRQPVPIRPSDQYVHHHGTQDGGGRPDDRVQSRVGQRV